MRLVICILVPLLLVVPAHAATIHVPADQPTIQAGINAAVNGDTVLVAPGVYVENINYGTKNIVLASNYVITGDTSIISATIIDGNNANPVVTIKGAQSNTAKISGFTIRHGSSPTSSGSGIDCGGNAQPVIEHNIIEDNHSGSGICAWIANPTIQFNVIRNNVSNEGGGIYCYQVSSPIRYNLIVGNRAVDGGGIFYYPSSCPVENNTLVDNTASHWGNAIMGSAAAIRNCIIWSSAVPDSQLYGSSGVTYSDVQKGYAGTGNISSDPLFVNPSAGDYRLQPGSPCIDAGDPNPIYRDDDGTRNDMGAIPYFRRLPTTLRVPSEFATIQLAIDSSINGDTILVAPGTYAGDGNRDIRFRGKNIQLTSESGPLSTIIECGADSLDPHRGFILDQSEDTLSIIDGFTIRNGIAPLNDPVSSAGGAVYCSPGTSFTMFDCVISNNSGYWVGGISADQSSPHISDCIFIGNSGFSLATSGEEPQRLVRCSFTDNEYGVSASRLIATECEFQNNDAAILVSRDGSVTNCGFNGNRQGIVYDPGWGALHIDSTDFRNNSAYALRIAGDGPTYTNVYIDGGMFVANTGVVIEATGTLLSVVETEFLDNGARVINANGSVIEIEQSTLAENSDLSGSVIVLNSASAVITRSSVTFNQAASVVGYSQTTDSAEFSCSDIFGNSGGDWVGRLASQLGINGNISADPLFCDTANDDYHIMDVSKCSPDSNSCGQLIGALGVGCSGIPAASTPAIAGDVLTNVRNHVPKFEWLFSSPVPAPQDSFVIAVGTDTNWTYAEMWNPAPINSSDTFVTYAGAPLVDGMTYYLRLRVHNGYAWSSWYETSFRMNSVPSVPIPRNPANDGIAGSMPTLWAGSALDAENDPLTYEFSGFHDTDCVEAPAIQILNVPGMPDSTGRQVTAALGENCRYWWQVRAYDGYEYSNWSALASFRVDGTPEPPTMPVLTEPPLADGKPVFTLLPTLKWSACTDPDPYDTVRYKVEISPFFVKDSLLTNSFTIADSLDFATKYYWRVTAWDKTHHQVVSPQKSFWTWALGDLNHSHLCDLSDLSALVSYLTSGGYVISPKMVGDLNGSCFVDLTDLSFMVNYLTGGGVQFKAGCE